MRVRAALWREREGGNVRNGRIRIHERAACLQHSRAGGVQFVVGMDEEQHVKCLLEPGVRSVMFFRLDPTNLSEDMRRELLPILLTSHLPNNYTLPLLP